MLQLNPPIPMDTPKGKGYAHILIDYGPEFDLLWVIFLDESRECWTYRNSDVRIQPNISLGRPPTKAVPERTPQSANGSTNGHISSNGSHSASRVALS